MPFYAIFIKLMQKNENVFILTEKTQYKEIEKGMKTQVHRFSSHKTKQSNQKGDIQTGW